MVLARPSCSVACQIVLKNAQIYELRSDSSRVIFVTHQ